MQDLGLHPPSWYGYEDYEGIIETMGVYEQGMGDSSGEVVVRVPRPETQIPRGYESVARDLKEVGTA